MKAKELTAQEMFNLERYNDIRGQKPKQTCKKSLQVEPIEPEPQYAKEPIANCDNCKHICTNSNIDHCHMYEPQPAYAVGDWVQCGIMQAEIRELREILARRQIYHMKEADGTEYDADSSAFDRKLKPSEVVVDFGNGIRGTIEASMPQTWIHVRRESDWKIIATLFVPNLGEPMRTIVKELLEKQKGETQ